MTHILHVNNHENVTGFYFVVQIHVRLSPIIIFIYRFYSLHCIYLFICNLFNVGVSKSEYMPDAANMCLFYTISMTCTEVSVNPFTQMDQKKKAAYKACT
jgi:hypothetical protein